MQKKIWKREIIQLIRGLFKIGRTQSKINTLNKILSRCQNISWNY